MCGRVRLLQRLQADLRRKNTHRKHQQNKEAADDRVQIVVERDALHLHDGLGGCEHLALRGGFAELPCERHEAEYQDLDRRIASIEETTFRELLPMFRGRKGTAA